MSVQRKIQTKPLKLALLFLAATLFGCSTSTRSTPAPSENLLRAPGGEGPSLLLVDANPFSSAPDQDLDQDCMADSIEYRVASYFRPEIIFDSRENARRAEEPVALFQVKTGLHRKERCSVPKMLVVKYLLLFAEDGGYVTSNLCKDAHHGDNVQIRVVVAVSEDGKKFWPQSIEAKPFQFPQDKLNFKYGRHPQIYLSAGKHHAYFDTSNNGKTSVDSEWPCVDAVNGKGAHVLVALESDHAPHGAHNVGERDAHPESAFVSDLTDWGFWGSSAWSNGPFCGGHLGGCEDPSDATTLSRIWE